MNQSETLQTETRRVKLISLSQKAQQIECKKCKVDPMKTDRNIFISTLNISKNSQLGDRLLCAQCSQIELATLNLDLAEDYLQMWKEGEEKIKQTKQDQFDEFDNCIQTAIQMLQKQYQTNLQSLQCYATFLKEELKKTLEKESTLDKQIDKLKNDFGEGSLRSLAEYLSKQNIINNKLERNDIDSEPDKTQPILEKTSQFLSKIGQSYLNQEQIQKINQVIKEFKQKKVQLKQQLLYKEGELIVPLKDRVTTLAQPERITSVTLKERVTAVAIKQGNQFIVQGFSNGVIILWNKMKKQWDKQLEQGLKIQDLVFSNKEHLFAAAYGKDIHLFNFKNSNVSEQIMQAHEKNIWKIKFNYSSNYIISCSEDKTFRIFNLEKNQLIYSISLAKPIYGIDISLDNQYMACCTQNEVYLYDSVQMECPTFLTKFKEGNRMTGVALSLKYLVICGDKIMIYNLDALKNQKLFEIIKTIDIDKCWDVKVIDDKYMVTNDGAIKIWNLNTFELIYCYKVPQAKINSINFDFEKVFAVSTDMKQIAIETMLLTEQK